MITVVVSLKTTLYTMSDRRLPQKNIAYIYPVFQYNVYIYINVVNYQANVDGLWTIQHDLF